MHIASLVKIPCYLHKLSSGNENMGVFWAGKSVKIWRNLPISNPKPDVHNINAHTKFDENPLMFTQVIIRKQKTDGRTMDGWTDGHTDDQHETVIHRHYQRSMFPFRIKPQVENVFQRDGWMDILFIDAQP